MSTVAKTPNYSLSQVAGSDIPDWRTDYTGDMLKIDTALKENADAIAKIKPDAYSSTKTYAVGDYCIHDDTMYKCKTAITEAAEWDVSYWQETTIFAELSALEAANSKLNEKTDKVTNTVASGYTVTDTGSCKINGIQYINAIISNHPVVSGDNQYFVIGFAPSPSQKASRFLGAFVVGSSVYPALYRIDASKNIAIFADSAIAGKTGNSYISTSYETN